MKLPVYFCHFSALLLTISAVSALTLQIDFNDSGVTQSGWQSIASGDNELGDSWSKNFPGGIGLDVDSIGSVALDDRDRGTNNGGGGEASMWRDFLFANGSFNSAPGSGLNLSLTGLQPNTEYPVKIWGYDSGSGGGRAADWNGGGSATQRLTFTSAPATLANNVVTTNGVTTDGSGNVTITGIVSRRVIRRVPTMSSSMVWRLVMRYRPMARRTSRFPVHGSGQDGPDRHGGGKPVHHRPHSRRTPLPTRSSRARVPRTTRNLVLAEASLETDRDLSGFLRAGRFSQRGCGRPMQRVPLRRRRFRSKW